ncbi:MAG: (2Fe-2S)-binding protein [Acidimicrobiia bacterium]|nr:(2Fe-2S)-binding protein [Acidimicrobiia bacterium]
MKPVPDPTGRLAVSMVVNGRTVERTVDSRRLLADLLRDDLRLTGTHLGCEHGVCGACTVLVDGRPVRSCLMLAVQADGREVTTVEGITPEDGLSPMQQAFKDHHGLQCGFCTPGFLMTLAGVEPDEHADEESVRDLLAGNLCRCTGYEGIVDAVMAGWGRSR